MRDSNHPSRQGQAQSPAAQATDVVLRELPIEAIEPYENNPRRAEHARYAELKRSIRADGITNPFTVTRRGPEQPYVTYGGGNTRLRIARELFAEGDMRFARLLVQVRPWPGEAQVMAAQLSENELRSDISFWEKACAVQQLKAQLEKDLGALSQRKLAGRLQALGLPYNVQMVGVFAFATGPMRVLGPWMRVRMANQKLRPAWNRLGQLARRLGLHRLQLQEGMDDRLARVNRKHADALARAASGNGKLPSQEHAPTEIDADALIADWHAAVAAMLDVTPDGLQEMLGAMISDSGLGAGLLMDVGQTASAPDDEGGQPSGTTIGPALDDRQIPLSSILANDLRSGLSFWEKARAVGRFKSQFEAENNTRLSADQLRDVLKQRGLTYDGTTLRTFLLAVNHLYPLGPWLEHGSTEKQLRPALLPLLDIGKSFNKSKDVDEILEFTNQLRADALKDTEARNKDLPAEERVSVKIDVDALVAEWHGSTADALGVTRTGLQAMLAVLASNPRVDAQTLMKVGRKAGVPEPYVPTPVQLPPQEPQQVPLGRMLAAVPGTGAGSAMPPILDELGLPISPNVGTRSGVDVLLQDIKDAIRRLYQHVHISDVVRFSPDLPRGFMVDFPTRTLEYFDDKDKGPIKLDPDLAMVRRNVWALLVDVSSQLDRRLVETIAPGATRWADLYRQGRETFVEAFAEYTGLSISEDGETISTISSDLIPMLAVLDLSKGIHRLFQLLYELQRRVPERLLTPPLRPLFGDVQ